MMQFVLESRRGAEGRTEDINQETSETCRSREKRVEVVDEMVTTKHR